MPVGPRGDASVVGATVRVTAGGRTIVREMAPTRSYLSQVERPLTIGLGDAAVVDRIEVEWAGGGRTVLENVPVDGTVLVGDADLPTLRRAVRLRGSRRRTVGRAVETACRLIDPA